MIYKQIIPAQDWYFVHASAQVGGAPVVYQLVCWAVVTAGEKDEVIGLIAPGLSDGKGITTVPPVPGRYLHREQLSDAELKVVSKR
ncbi:MULTISPECIES: hypothetical protein [Pseudomonas]|uniref:Methionyl-tRNA formyltransferase n=1 Tax=Pseudomonas nitroreducens TaxID=46680 RepID=A0A6G6J7S5_PSENT|nr:MULTISPECIES: hypothetical protein [Pseudomonas]QIE91120.1 methionyl-tRNA formyltransferase [Pseudomonas nitroreducens]UCL90268.1 hypothetical protein LDJ84_30305 [Pseudomonas sp. HS-18]